MTEPALSRPTISDPNFSRAVALIDAGEADALADWLQKHPALLSATADEDGSFAGAYFAQPKLLWFVAENPIRNGVLPRKIAQVTQVIIDAARRCDVADLNDQIEYTLSLVCSGKVARESGVQKELITTLVAAGADPNTAMRAALGHGEFEACKALLEADAAVTLSVAAGLQQEQTLKELFDEASVQEKQDALAVAAINGYSRITRILVDSGCDPNQYCPEGLGDYATPLHHAIATDSLSTVCALVTRGADMSIKDRNYGGHARDWAEHFGHADIAEFLAEAERFMPAVQAIRTGDVVQLQAWLKQYPTWVNKTLGDNPRTLLHYATDWPGHWPKVAESIRLLLVAGADLNSRFLLTDVEAKETPLHWATSSGDFEAVRALVEGGADINAIGGCIDNATPLKLAEIFGYRQVTDYLRAVGARQSSNVD